VMMMYPSLIGSLRFSSTVSVRMCVYLLYLQVLMSVDYPGCHICWTCTYGHATGTTYDRGVVRGTMLPAFDVITWANIENLPAVTTSFQSFC
jgi:hypothetical protein